MDYIKVCFDQILLNPWNALDIDHNSCVFLLEIFRTFQFSFESQGLRLVWATLWYCSVYQLNNEAGATLVTMGPDSHGKASVT